MRAIVLMFDSLNRQFLPTWNDDVKDLPNFQRLQAKTAAFDNCYVGSVPCMPARRDMQTGRYNFLHRSWGPLEPFDDSAPELLKQAGVYCHLVTDHQHYWEDGGATYHNRFNSYEFFRGQEGDAWKGVVEPEGTPDSLSWRRGKLWRQDWINRRYMQTAEAHPQNQTVSAGLEFIETNKGAQNWLLQIECFDPHEPFFCVPDDTDQVGPFDGSHFDWPDYRPVVEDAADVERLRDAYRGLLQMCDLSLGRVLDAMDEHDMWADTTLIVCTDHGLLLGEREWYGKNVMPWFQENAHTPLFVWSPRCQVANVRCDALVQTIDFAPTFLDIFGLSPTADMQGISLLTSLQTGSQREAVLFGLHGGHVNVTDGRYVYMRASVDVANGPLFDYTLMPTRMDHRFSVDDLKGAELHKGFSFTKSVPMLKTKARAMGNPFHFGTRLYDLAADPFQITPLQDDAVELRMAQLLVDLMRHSDAPPEQFERLGLPSTGAVREAHLLAKAQAVQVANSDSRDWKQHPADGFGQTINTPLYDLGAEAKALVLTALSLPAQAPILQRFAHLTVWQLAVMLPAATPQTLRSLDDKLKDNARV